MELDTSRMTGIETAMSDLVASQAESGPGVGKVKGVLEKMRSNTGLLYEKLEYIVSKSADYIGG